MKRFSLTLLALAAVSCGSPRSELYADSALGSITAYRVDPNRITPAGTRVTDSRDELALPSLDEAIAGVADCLASVPEPSTFQAEDMRCIFPRLRRQVDRSAFSVLVAPDWYVSKCTNGELFPCEVDSSACDRKPALLGVACPCACRATVQDNRTIVTVPSAAPAIGEAGPARDVFRAELIRLVTACNNIWVGPLYQCAQGR